MQRLRMSRIVILHPLYCIMSVENQIYIFTFVLSAAAMNNSSSSDDDDDDNNNNNNNSVII